MAYAETNPEILQQVTDSAAAVSKKYIVKYKNYELSAPSKSNAMRGAAVEATYGWDEAPTAFMNRIGAVALELTDSEAAQLQSSGDVEYIEEDTSFTTDFAPTQETDSYRYMNLDSQNHPWGFNAIGGNTAAPAGYKGAGIKIAVLDTGISPHPDLSIAGGVSFVEGTSSYADDYGHGTHVAGTIAALDNTIGTIGVASQASIYAVKVLDQNGNGYASGIIQGIEWAIQNNMNIISMSFGASNYNQALHEAVQDAAAHGILLIASAGNRGMGDETENYPARYPEVISVGAVNKNHQRAAFSSTGSELDLVAPGTDIVSTTNTNNYGAASGTSMAAPHVTGAAAVIWARNRQLSAAQVKDALQLSATSLGALKEYGSGIVNLPKSLGLSQSSIPPIGEVDMNNTSPLIDPLTGDTYSVSLTLAGAVADLTTPVPTPNPANGNWRKVCTAVTDPNNSDIYLPNNCQLHDGSTVNLKQNSSFTYKWSIPSSAVLGTYKVRYTFCTASECSRNVGPNTFTVTVPQPDNVKAVLNQNQIKVSWTPLDSKYGVMYYNVNVNGSTTKVPQSEYTFTGDPGNKYTISVAGRKDNVDGTYSSPVAVTVPSAPAKPNSPGNLSRSSYTPTSITLSWSNVTGATAYLVRKNGQEVAQVQPNAGGTTTYQFTGLEEATSYNFSVASYSSATQTSSDYSPITSSTADYGSTPATAFLVEGLSLGSSISWGGKIQSSGDYDLFRFRPRESGKYEFTTSGSLDAFGALYNASYQLLEENDDSGDANIRLLYDLQAGTDYYLEISSFNDISIGSYRINVYSYIDDYRGYADASAAQLPLNTTKTGLINYSGDTDMFRFTASQTGIYRFTSAGSTDVVGTLLDQEGIFIEQNDDANGTLNFQIEARISQGETVYLKVKHYYPQSTGAYSVSAALLNSLTDTTPPAAPAFSLSADKVLTINYSADSAIRLYSVGESGEFFDYSAPFSLAIDTKVYTIAIDNSGNATETVYPGYAKDTVKPTVPGGLSVVSKTPTSVTIKWSPSTDNVAVTGYGVYNGSTLVTTVNALSTTISGLVPNTAYSFKVNAKDAENNTSDFSTPLSVTTERDVTPPSAPSISLSHTQLTNSDVTVTIAAGTDSESAIARTEYKLGTAGTWQTYSKPFIISQNGNLVVFARTIDQAGNISAESSATVKIDKVAPALPTVNPIYYPSTMVTGTAESGTAVYVKSSTTTYGSAIASSGTFTVKIPPLSSGTELFVSATDAAGNSSASQKITVATDTVAPSIPGGLTASSITCSTAVLTWTPSTDNAGVQSYEIYSGTTLLTKATGSTVNVTGLKPLTSYTLTVKAKDAAGNLSSSSNSVTVTTLKDTQAPSAPTGLSLISKGTSHIVLSWTPSTDDSGIKEYQVWRYFGNSGKLAGTASISNLFLSDIGSYPSSQTFFVKAVDWGGNISNASDFFSVTIDTTAPTAPTGLILSSLATPTAVLSWNPAADASGIERYNITSNGASVGSTTGTSVTLTGLKPATTYKFVVRATDTWGNYAESSYTVTTYDTVPPTPPGNITVASKTSDSVTLNWTASTDNVRILYYDILVDGVYKGTSTTTTYTVTGLALNKAYKITVKANDGSGNTASADISVTLTP
ncbi:S8 family serine peptidase [Paenibacillus tengchongensis]|uniref:S8 family serine peptidase n=1 Tax=Paenibacillus tengchongensis TaxID=2608684 RepID=UPI0016522421|nr:S8 family serine peptidase [Paenibacillus tengchongensis]